jgi:hypothetical protein
LYLLSCSEFLAQAEDDLLVALLFVLVLVVWQNQQLVSSKSFPSLEP